jgi:hypothetical protein
MEAVIASGVAVAIAALAATIWVARTIEKALRDGR